MDAAKKKRLEKAGWQIGTAQEFLELSDIETAYVEIKAALARELAERRRKLNVTQVQVAKRLHSSQSRIAKMEAADTSVSLDLMIRSLLALGATRRELARAMRSAGRGQHV